MSYSRPTLQQLRDRVASDIEFRIADADAHTPGTGYTELAQVIAGVAHGLYGNQQHIAAQILIATCDDDTLMQRAGERGLSRIPPQFASGVVTLTGTNGSVIVSETVLQSVSGAQFRSTAAATIVAGSALVSVIAQDAGAAGNLATGTALALVNPIAGVDSQGAVSAPGLSAGTDIESIDRLRTRLLENLRQPPMGGKDYDYKAWAKAASVDVTRAWVFPHENGIGSITVRFVCEDLANPIPTAGHITLVTNSIAAQRPAGLRNLTVAAPAAVPMNLTFTALSPNTAAVKAAIEAEVKDLIRREYEPGGTLLLSHIRESISRAAGETNYVITLNADLNYTASQFPTLGNTTWPAL